MDALVVKVRDGIAPVLPADGVRQRLGRLGAGVRHEVHNGGAEGLSAARGHHSTVGRADEVALTPLIAHHHRPAGRECLRGRHAEGL